MHPMRATWPWLLAIALVAAQALGFMHRIVHAPLAGAASHAHADAHGHAPGHWQERLFAGHDEDSCRVVDSLGQGGLAAPSAACPSLAPAAGPLPDGAGEALARWAALFDARGPPLPVR